MNQESKFSGRYFLNLFLEGGWRSDHPLIKLVRTVVFLNVSVFFLFAVLSGASPLFALFGALVLAAWAGLLSVVAFDKVAEKKVLSEGRVSREDMLGFSRAKDSRHAVWARSMGSRLVAAIWVTPAVWSVVVFFSLLTNPGAVLALF